MRSRWKIWVAFGIIYFVWGSTFLAIKEGVAEVPPLLFASLRFAVAGAVLCLWAGVRGARAPTVSQWRAIALIAFLIFVVDYGLLFWAEQRVPSGIAAVILATIPAFMSLAEILWLRTRRPTLRLSIALVIGMGGIVVLLNPSRHLGTTPISTQGVLGLLIAGLSWSIASIASLRLPMPTSKVVTAGTQMLVGGILLGVTSVGFGELHYFNPHAVTAIAWLSLLYLIVAGSLVGFTAYTWLLHHVSPTKVSTYAYVNPIVAVLLGYLFAGEGFQLRTVLGAAFIIFSVIVVLTDHSGRTERPLDPEGKTRVRRA